MYQTSEEYSRLTLISSIGKEAFCARTSHSPKVMRAKRRRRTWPITWRGPQGLAGTVCATPQILIDAEGNGEVMGADRFTDQRKDTPRRSSTPYRLRAGRRGSGLSSRCRLL